MIYPEHGGPYGGGPFGSVSSGAVFGQAQCPPIHGLAGFQPLSAGWQPTGVGQFSMQPPPTPEAFHFMTPPAHLSPGWPAAAVPPMATPFMRPPPPPPAPPPPAGDLLRLAATAGNTTGTNAWQPPAELSIRPHSAEQDYSIRLLAAKGGATSKAPSLAGPGVIAAASGQAATQIVDAVTPEVFATSTEEPVSSAKQELRKGVTVRLHSLKTFDLNGKVGVLEEFDAVSGRWRVFIDGELKSLKPENLKAHHDGGGTVRERSRSRSPSAHFRASR